MRAGEDGKYEVVAGSGEVVSVNARAVVDVNSEVVTGRDVSGFSVVVSCPAKVVTDEDED